MDEQMIERAVSGLLGLHERMLAAVKANRPYPVSIRLGESDTDAVLNGAVALENTRAAHGVIAGKVAELTATVAKLREALGNSDALPAQLLLDADEMEACGAGNEAANMRKLVDRLLAARAALAPQIKGTDQP